jgi:ABC-type lipoprotein release transport system permease subunit
MFLFKNITKMKSVPEVFRRTIFEKVMEMSRIKTLPKEQKEDWKKELDNNRYVQEAIEINREQGYAEGVADKEKAVEKAVEQAKAEAIAEAAINAYQKGNEEGELKQLKSNIIKMKSKGMSGEEIKDILDLEELPPLD